MNFCRCFGRPVAATYPRLGSSTNDAAFLKRPVLGRRGNIAAPRQASTSRQDDHEPEIVLYQRITNPSVTLMQSGFALSSLHTGYWIWYTFDFIPMVNAAQMQDLHVDPAIGFAGILFASALNFVFYLYPKRLVHKLSYRPDSQKIMLYTHQPPLMRRSIYPLASFPVGKPGSTGTSSDAATDTKTKYLKISSEAISIINQYGDVTRFRGHLKLGKWPFYNLDIQSPKDVPEPELLMEALLRPEYFEGRDFLQRNNHKHTTSSKNSLARQWRNTTARPKIPKKKGRRRR